MAEYREHPGYPGYRFGSDGSIWSRHRKGCKDACFDWRQMKLVPKHHGYLHLRLKAVSGKIVSRHVHRLILEAFYGLAPQDHESRHLNGISNDNRIRNLEWTTHQINIQDTITHGHTRRWPRIITPAIAIEIQCLFRAGEIKAAIARRFGIDPRTVTATINKEIRS